MQFSAEESSSIVSEWSLVCDQNYKSKGTMSAFMAGVMLGLFGLLSTMCKVSICF